MPSAADVRSILSLSDPTSKQGPSQQKKTPAATRKPEGIPRELYSLIGPSAPSLAAKLAKPRYKAQKPNLGGGPGTRIKWELRTFKNSARKDPSTDPEATYPFAKYNIQPAAYTYSQDEYTRFLEDKDWSKEETDYLFNVAQEFDLRWYIIHDRYAFQDGPSRALEDLKDRYYSVCRKLVRNRPWAGDEASKAQLISSFQFDKDRELTRKKYLTSLENRTPEQMVEEEALYIEIKRLEQNERKFRRDRDDLLRTLAGIESGLPDVVEDDLSALGLATDVIRKKKKGAAMDVDSPSTPSVASAITPVVKRPQQPAKSAAYDALHCIIRTEPPNNTSATKAAHHPAYLRSYRLPILKPAIQPKITQALAELGISHSRLVMPTRENCAQLESLLEATTALVETKRLVDKVEYDIQVIKERLGMRRSQVPDGDGESVIADAMDVDESNDADGETIADDGRAQSVLSASTRGRKQPRRSMSISSVDTTGTTRAGTKRQKRG
ncbi:hypothetical protein BDQ17DRAFT_1351968 [Cyathus striatus]|nr:hypothetical protein BDQ17DRAFT_1351968 [Cyathus striatus]